MLTRSMVRSKSCFAPASVCRDPFEAKQADDHREVVLDPMVELLEEQRLLRESGVAFLSHPGAAR